MPAVPWDFIVAFQSNNYIPEKSVRSHFDCTALSFASIVEDDANAPDIKRGDSVIVDPDQVPAPGDYVVAKVKGAPVLRRFQPRDGSVHLSASNPDYPSYTVTDWLDSYVGTITETARPRRR